MIIVQVEVKLEQTRVSSQFNKPVHSVVVMRNDWHTLCSCNGNGKVQASENVTVKILKELMTELEFRLSGKGEAGSKGGQAEIYIYLFQLIIIIFLKDQMKIYIMNFQSHFQMQL